MKKTCYKGMTLYHIKVLTKDIKDTIMFNIY